MALIGLALTQAGCLPDPINKSVWVHKRSDVLDGQSVAVLVTVPDNVSNQLDASHLMAGMIAKHLNKEAKNVRMLRPDRVKEYCEKHPYWFMSPPTVHAQQLGVDRLLLVDLSVLRGHAPGNPDVVQGMASGVVHVYGHDASDTSQSMFSTQMKSQYPLPRKNSIGMPEGFGGTHTSSRMEYRAMELFSWYTAGLFFDHEEER